MTASACNGGVEARPAGASPAYGFYATRVRYSLLAPSFAEYLSTSGRKGLRLGGVRDTNLAPA